jgi:hypothetical protein
MAATTLNLLDHVVPKVGLRQFVLTVPHALRARLAYDGPLLGAVSRIFVDSILAWYRRRMGIEGAADGRSGAVTVVQRTSADLKLNPHIQMMRNCSVMANIGGHLSRSSPLLQAPNPMSSWENLGDDFLDSTRWELDERRQWRRIRSQRDRRGRRSRGSSRGRW